MHVPEYEATETPRVSEPEAATARTRDTGTLVWMVADDPPSPSWRDILTQPLHADLAAARKWLTTQLESGALEAGEYRPCRIHATVTAKVETQVRVIFS